MRKDGQNKQKTLRNAAGECVRNINVKHAQKYNLDRFNNQLNIKIYYQSRCSEYILFI